MEVQILHYYLKVFSLVVTIILILLALYFLNTFNKQIVLNKDPVIIKKGETFENILNQNIKNLSVLDIELIKVYLKIRNKYNKNFIHYGDFKIKDNSNIYNFINIISKPSNILNKITIVEGWSRKQLDIELSKHFNYNHSIPYNNLIADTYFIEKNMDFNNFIKKLNDIKNEYFKKYQKNKLFKIFNENEIIIIGSLLEKEGLDYFDKKNISSVIFNRLKKDMKLQIDATVIFALTDGEYDLERKILLSDLNINHPYNTYKIKGLPPQPISYVGKKTLDILFENYESEFLFYFFDKSLNRHIFSENYKKHKKKLYEYRNKH